MIPIDEQTIVSILEAATLRSPDRRALRDPNTDYTYSQVWTSAGKMSGGLQSLGLTRGSALLMMLNNHVDYVISSIASSFRGLIEVPINTAYKGSVLSHIINDSQASVILVEAEYLDTLYRIAADLPFLRTVVVRGTEPTVSTKPDLSGWRVLAFGELVDHAELGPDDCGPSDVVAIAYTSGTTGPSKGVLLPQAFAYGIAAPRPEAGWLGTRADDVNFCCLPMFHHAGRWGCWLNAFTVGASAYISPRFSASGFLNEVRGVGGTVSGFVGGIGEMLMRQPAKQDDADNPLREVAMVPLVGDVDAFERRFGLNVVTSYGTTEAGCVLVDDATLPRGTYRARKDYELMVVDDRDVAVADGDVGELVVRPPAPWTTLIGYHRNPEASHAVWRNGWLHTGDAFRAANGGLTFVDRIKDCIRRRGENISSVEIEVAALRHPRVSECAAYAVPSDIGEDEVMIAVVTDGILACDELWSYLGEMLPMFMVPRYIRITPDLPKTPTSKVQKGDLRLQGVDGAWDKLASRPGGHRP